ncbi:N-acetylmuramoyl-L-alanine amidase [Nocardioides zeae]|uniref:N-acetylmuramoyl-L-alanine amidase n=1 Tax=Nocardioides imazamoxiresistens TaxID=3231893 RepID=A0ABU3PRP0_9ACTN|nr:N-acetylmuramoyl-L-alanine amidase [Nocardioides zeae]MDT9591894.1 N-acetylmuramoyl-L-alanine amidase [Nocardioides zeae]
MDGSRETMPAVAPSAVGRRAVLATGGAAALALTGLAGMRTGAYAAPAARVALAAPGGRGVVRDASVTVPTGRTTLLRTDPFSMAALIVPGGTLPSVRLRARTAEGWGPWSVLGAVGDGPDLDSAEGASARSATAGRTASDLSWTGLSDQVEVEVGASGAREAQLVLLDPGFLSADRSALTAAPDSTTRNVVNPPHWYTRRWWGADESWRDPEGPTYNSELLQAHVHHTVNTNYYAKGDVPGILRGIYRYHTHSLGWSDVGYNWFVDRFGRIFNGRAGSAAGKVRGAHTLGFNHNSTGIAAVGNFQNVIPPTVLLNGIASIAAWKLSHGVGRATGTVTVTSWGSDRYRDGWRGNLPVVDGHRDTNQTACPGGHLYARLGYIRQKAQAILSA